MEAFVKNLKRVDRLLRAMTKQRVINFACLDSIMDNASGNKLGDMGSNPTKGELTVRSSIGRALGSYPRGCGIVAHRTDWVFSYLLPVTTKMVEIMPP